MTTPGTIRSLTENLLSVFIFASVR
jgi:hypothetical protein